MNVEIWSATITFYITTLALHDKEKKSLGIGELYKEQSGRNH